MGRDKRQATASGARDDPELASLGPPSPGPTPRPGRVIAAARDELSDPARLEALAASLPERPWLRVLDTDHFFADALDDLAAACGEAIAWGQASPRAGCSLPP